MGYWANNVTDSMVIADVVMALDNLVSAAMSKMDAIDTLDAASKQLAEALTNTIKESGKLLIMVSQLTTNATKPKPQKQCTPNSYCWTHSFVMNIKTCNNKAPDHKNEVTKNNTMGGNLANKPTTH